ncbi:GDNF family receptor alpha-1a isoform X2 [Girardinichthys multiradiatus]|uniref:GDNF family receptor alpha-1a isoform X2 n=1 Tax=Girardinichthys multiradiatus TaxID=208333 RepID=UPI001FACD2A4|nr:GDNF family receptor alpha-1a isoform X2 [Girardinichthys multiradiatus]
MLFNTQRKTMIFALLYFLPLIDVLTYAEENLRAGASRLDCVRASDQCLREQACSTKYRTMRQCVAGGKESNFSLVAGVEARDECRSAMEALKQSPLYNCRCKRGMKKEKNCLRIYWGFYQSLQGNDFLEESPYEPVNKRLSDIFRLAPILGEPAVARENNCLTAAKACNLNDTCKKYRSAYISPCTSRVSTAEICNKRKCHKALRQFFDKVPPKHSYGMLFCSCPVSDQTACSERRRQTIVPVCSYEEKQMPNCLELQATCKTNYICRSRLADFFVNCMSEPRSLSGCLKENYADCLLSYSGLIGTVMTPNYLRSPKISVSPYCDCTNSGNNKDDCDKFTEFFTENTCLRNAIQAFGNGTDIGMWPPLSPIQTTTSITTPYQRNRERNPNNIDNHINVDSSLYHFCGNLQAQKLHSNTTVDVCSSDPQAPKVDGPSASNAILKDSAVCRQCVGVTSLLPLLLYFGAQGYL